MTCLTILLDSFNIRRSLNDWSTPWPNFLLVRPQPGVSSMLRGTAQTGRHAL